MNIDFVHYFIVLMLPSLIGSLAFSLAARTRTEIKITTALILALLTYVTMITGLYFFKDVFTTTALTVQLECLSFSRRYILLSSGITIFYGVAFGLLRRLFWWVRQ